jgi:hypothetical protein
MIALVLRAVNLLLREVTAPRQPGNASAREPILAPWLCADAFPTLASPLRWHYGRSILFLPDKTKAPSFSQVRVGLYLNRFKEEPLEILPCHRRRRCLYGRAVEWCLGAAAMRVETTGDILHRHDCLHHIKELLSVVQSEGMRWKFWAIWWSARGCSRGRVAPFDHLLWRHY